MSLFDTSCGGVSAACSSIEATTGAASANSNFQNVWGQAYESLSQAFNTAPVPSTDPGSGAVGSQQEFNHLLYLAINEDPSDNGAAMQTFLNRITDSSDSNYNANYINFLSNTQIVALQNTIAKVQNASGQQTQQNLETTVSSLKSLVEQSENAGTNAQQTQLQMLQSVNGQIVNGIQTTAQTGNTAASFGQIVANCLQSMG